MKRLLLVFLLSSLISPIPVAMAAHKQPHYKMYWRVRNGEIAINTVCDNYGYGSIAYRGCRAQAKRYFEKRCQAYKNKESQSSGSLSQRYHRKRLRFCHAATQFGAVD